MFGSLQAGRATECTYLTPSSLSLHLAPFFYWWSNLQWGDKGRLAFSINALIRAQQALQHLSDWQTRYSGFCRHPIPRLCADTHAQTHTHVTNTHLTLAFALIGFCRLRALMRGMMRTGTHAQLITVKLIKKCVHSSVSLFSEIGYKIEIITCI